MFPVFGTPLLGSIGLGGAAEEGVGDSVTLPVGHFCFFTRCEFAARARKLTTERLPRKSFCTGKKFAAPCGA